MRLLIFTFLAFGLVACKPLVEVKKDMPAPAASPVISPVPAASPAPEKKSQLKQTHALSEPS